MPIPLRAESGAFGAEPFTVDNGGDGRIVEVEILVVGFAHHIHVALEDEGGSLFVAGGGGHRHHDVAYGVGLNGDIMFCSEVEEILTDTFLLFRGTGHLCDFVEDFEHTCRFEVFDCHDKI